jgi:hypothetical protein
MVWRVGSKSPDMLPPFYFAVHMWKASLRFSARAVKFQRGHKSSVFHFYLEPKNLCIYNLECEIYFGHLAVIESLYVIYPMLCTKGGNTPSDLQPARPE